MNLTDKDDSKGYKATYLIIDVLIYKFILTNEDLTNEEEATINRFLYEGIFKR